MAQRCVLHIFFNPKCVYMCVYTVYGGRRYICLYIYIYIETHIYIHIYIYVYIYIYTTCQKFNIYINGYISSLHSHASLPSRPGNDERRGGGGGQRDHLRRGTGLQCQCHRRAGGIQVSLFTVWQPTCTQRICLYYKNMNGKKSPKATTPIKSVVLKWECVYPWGYVRALQGVREILQKYI